MKNNIKIVLTTTVSFFVILAVALVFAFLQQSPYDKVLTCNYKGEKAYYYNPGCCDQFSSLYSDTGKKICGDWGGFTGDMINECPDFDESTCKRNNNLQEKLFEFIIRLKGN